MPLPRESKSAMPMDRTSVDVAFDFGRAAAQGVSFGFADEIEAVVRSAFDSGKTYAEVVTDVRRQINDFRKRNPGAAYATEIGAAILPTIAAQYIPFVGPAAAATTARTAQLARSAGLGSSGQRAAQVGVASAGQGAVYGAGAAEGTPLERLDDAATSAAISGLAGPAIDRVAPRVTSKARELLSRGIPLTPGQAVGESGIVGRGLKRLEEGVADNVFIVGDAVRGALDRAQTGFNRAAVAEALQPIGVKIPKGLEGRALIGFGQRALTANYNRTLGKMKVSNTSDLLDEIITVTKASDPDIKEYVDNRAFKDIINKINPEGELSGKSLKLAQSSLRRYITRLKRDGSEEAMRKADALEDLRNVLNVQIGRENPKLAPQLNRIDQAYGQFEIVRNAELRRKTVEGFNPGDLLQAAAKGDATKRQSKFSAGEARMQRLAQSAQDVIGGIVPDSGTSQRQVARQILSGGGMGMGLQGLDPISQASTLLAPGAYTRPGVPVARMAVDALGRGARAAVPALSATDFNQRLADALMNR
jgi:hypothetical protein